MLWGEFARLLRERGEILDEYLARLAAPAHVTLKDAPLMADLADSIAEHPESEVTTSFEIAANRDGHEYTFAIPYPEQLSREVLTGSIEQTLCQLATCIRDDANGTLTTYPLPDIADSTMSAATSAVSGAFYLFQTTRLQRAAFGSEYLNAFLQDQLGVELPPVVEMLEGAEQAEEIIALLYGLIPERVRAAFATGTPNPFPPAVEIVGEPMAELFDWLAAERPRPEDRDAALSFLGTYLGARIDLLASHRRGGLVLNGHGDIRTAFEAAGHLPGDAAILAKRIEQELGPAYEAWTQSCGDN